MLLGNQTEDPRFHTDHHAIGYFLIAFTIYTALITVAALSQRLALFIVFLLLLIGFILLDIAHFHDAPGLKQAAGWVLLVCALGAWYVMVHILYQDCFGYDLLPAGQSTLSIVWPLIRMKWPHLPLYWPKPLH